MYLLYYFFYLIVITSCKLEAIKLLTSTAELFNLNEFELMYFSIAFEKSNIPLLSNSNDIKQNFDVLAYSIKVSTC